MLHSHIPGRGRRAIPMPVGRRRQPAFTLVELLVSIGICVLFAGLLVPALVRVGEAANCTSCRNNLRTLGRAAHLYHDAHGKLPPGQLAAAPDRTTADAGFWNSPWVGTLPFLLPFLEENQLALQLPAWDIKSQGPAWWTDEAMVRPARTAVAVFFCPSDQAQTSRSAALGLHNYRGGVARLLSADPAAGAGFARTNYLGVQGVFDSRTQVSLDWLAAQAGTSHSAMLGETLGGSPDGPRDYAWAWMGSPPLPEVGSANRSPSWLRFSSRHTGLVLFYYADGSVRGQAHCTAARQAAPAPTTADWLLSGP